jgi:hypothetical protein
MSNHVIHVKSWHSFQIMSFMSNHVIHVKSCHLCQIMSFMSNHVCHDKSCQIMSFMSNHVIHVKSCHGSLDFSTFDTITTVTPSPTRPPAGHILTQGRRGAQEEGEAHQGGHRLHHCTPHQSFYLNKDVKPDGLDVVVKKVNSCT